MGAEGRDLELQQSCLPCATHSRLGRECGRGFRDSYPLVSKNSHSPWRVGEDFEDCVIVKFFASLRKTGIYSSRIGRII